MPSSPAPFDRVAHALTSLKVIFSGPLPLSVHLSCDGALLAAVERRVDWDRNRNLTQLRVVRTDTGEAVAGPDLPDQVSQVSWHRRHQRLAFVSKEGDSGSALFEWDLEQGRLDRRFASNQAIRGHVRAEDDFLVLCALPAETSAGVTEFPRQVRQAPLVRASDKTEAAHLPENAESLSLSADGMTLAYVSRPSLYGEDLWRGELFVHDLASGRSRRVGAAGRGATVCRYAPIGGELAFLARTPRPGYVERNSLFVLGEDGTERHPTAGWNRSVGDILGWGADGRSVLVLTGAGMRTEIVEIDAQTSQERPCKHGVILHAAAWQGMVRAWVEAAPAALPEARIEGRPASPPRPAEACPQEVVRWADASGRVLEGLLAEPRQTPRPWPTVLLVHGGPASQVCDMLNRTDYLQPIAAAGFAVFMPAFRGSGGYEQDFVHANVGDFADGPLDDCLRGLDSLVKKGVADPARLAVAGASYGGYLTLYALTQTSRFRCGVCICGLSDLISDTASGSRPTFIREYYGRYPWEAPEMIWRISPLSRVADVSAPLLLLHGEADVNTPVHHARELAFALRVLGRPFRFRSYPGEGHGLDRPAVRLDVVAEMVRWLDAHLVANPA